MFDRVLTMGALTCALESLLVEHDALLVRRQQAGTYTLSRGTSMSATPHTWLDNISSDHPDGLHCAWDFRADVYGTDLVRAMFESYGTLLQALANDPQSWELRAACDLPGLSAHAVQGLAGHNEEHEGI